jgi:hypothetical protein
MNRSVWWSKLLEAIIRQGYPLWIVILSQLTLFGLITYRLISKADMTEEERKIYSYTELALSFVASFLVLVFFFMSLLFIFSLGPLSALKNPMFYRILISCLVTFFISPLGLTTLRLSLDDKLTEEQKDILSGLTLPTIAFFGWTGLFYAVGNIR